MIRIFALACLSVIVAASASAQVGGNGVSKPSSTTLGYTQFVAPPPAATKLNIGGCKGWPLPSFGQPQGLVGGFAAVPDAHGTVHYLSGC